MANDIFVLKGGGGGAVVKHWTDTFEMGRSRKAFGWAVWARDVYVYECCGGGRGVKIIRRGEGNVCEGNVGPIVRHIKGHPPHSSVTKL